MIIGDGHAATNDQATFVVVIEEMIGRGNGFRSGERRWGRRATIMRGRRLRFIDSTMRRRESAVERSGGGKNFFGIAMTFRGEGFGELRFVNGIAFFQSKGSFRRFGEGDVGETFVFTGEFIDDDFDLNN